MCKAPFALSDRNQDLLQPSITHQVDAVRLRQAGVEDSPLLDG
jgi:hypothetical protein